MKSRYWAGIFACVAVSYYCACTPYSSITKGDRTPDCLDFGNAPFPIWSHLTNPEIALIKKADSARAGNPDELLSLALFASGNIRDSVSYAHFESQVKTFVRSIAPEINKIKDSKEKGRILYSKICKSFYGSSFAKNPLSAYRFEQSQLTELLRTKKMNCISSALLCIVIYRYFGFDIQGVILPEHAFVQIRALNGDIIEIESTNNEGYDFKHDSAFFSNKSLKWYKDLNLSPITKEDYNSRRGVSPFELVCYNCFNQHTQENRMSLCNQNRLYEVGGYLNPFEPVVFMNRLSVYINTFCRFDKEDDNAAGTKMFDKVGDAFAFDWQKIPPSKEKIENIALFRIYWALSLVRANRFRAAIAKTDSLLAELDTTWTNKAVFITNAGYIYAMFGKELFAQKKITEAETLYQNCPSRLRNTAVWRTGLLSIYQSLFSGSFKKKDYTNAIAHGFKALNYSDSSTQKTVYENIEAAYLNLALGHSEKKEKSAAEAVLKECVEKLPGCEKCPKRLKTAR